MQYWSREIGTIKLRIEEDQKGYFVLSIEDEWAGSSVQVSRDELQRMVDYLQEYLDG